MYSQKPFMGFYSIAHIPIVWCVLLLTTVQQGDESLPNQENTQKNS